MMKSESIKELAGAMAKAQADIENASKSATNPHFRSKYADLAEILNTVRPVLSACGLSVIQMPSYESGIVSVETVVAHESGEWISSVISAPVTKHDAQGVGSAVTYCRRYSLAAMCGVAQEDDDAASAVGTQRQQTQNLVPAKPHPALVKKINCAETIADLAAAWGEIPADQKLLLEKCKDQRKAALQGVQ